MKRLQEARKKAEEVSRRRQRIEGELDGHQKRLAELEKKCREDYGCEVAELPELSAQLEKEAEQAIVEAERLLTVPAEPVKTEPVKTIPVKPVEPAKVPPRRSPTTKVMASSEEDVL
jgi:DNA repair ATPase RecN